MNSATGGQVRGWWVLVSSSLEEAFGFTNWAGMLILLMLLGVIRAACGVLMCWAALGGSAWGRLLGRRTIPGPRGMPIIGSLLEMGGQAHRRLTELAVLHKATKLMALSFGETQVVIASEPEPAREILHSFAFVDRPVKQSAQQLLFGRANGFAPCGDYWRGLRRITANHMFALKRIAAYGKARLVELQRMLAAISHDVPSHGRVQVRDHLQRASLNNIKGGVFGRRYETGSPKATELNAMVREGFELLGAFNWADHLPAVKCLEVHQRCRRCAVLVPKVAAFVQRVIDEHVLSGARLSTQDVCVAGTTAMVNMYAITHDPALWARPESFGPERYLEQDIDVRGNELRLARFSPGCALGLATVLQLVRRSMRRLARN